ncbi:probable selenide,water dikinase [Desulfotalea psychrophila LSv54]|uniref:Selenide, water dikinase n=1 Tax=Desulfotalea psychrophila (strain LSv54 / DSM 12343) TaxID=177439 RepID=Q6APM6_DESPS|nr:probable selenide,water dikinase [Desulfotalea psychrophila LSv54]
MLVGMATADDAGVYKVSDELALIQTLDFFTPIVDDPYDFGRIAAANALSDVYAMGGVPQTAMNIVAYPMKTLGREPLREMLAGGSAMLREANTVLLGGHSVEDEELKYGLSVTGFVHPDKILANQGLRTGDVLILTKAIGTGILNTAIKARLASKETIEELTELMVTLNKKPAEIMREFNISACTDITGFGLLGHIAEMIDGSDKSITIQSQNVPILNQAHHFASMGLVPIGAHNNRAFRKEMMQIPKAFDPVLRDILFDPQTSGGLLIGCAEEDGPSLVRRLQDAGVKDAQIIGFVTENRANIIQIS